MQTINISELNLDKLIGVGNWNVVKKCLFDNSEYCAKFFNNSYPKEIIYNIASLTEIDFEFEYFTPLYIIENNNGKPIGYLMNYIENLEKINYEKKEILMPLLKNARNIIGNLHKTYKRFHGDAVLDNIIFDKNSNKAYLIDFDVSLPFGEKLENCQYFRLYIKDYLKYYKQDKNIDIYAFNISTLMNLYNYDRFYSLFQDINDNKIPELEQNKEVKRLAKELLLKDIKNSYSGEYIIDYL